MKKSKWMQNTSLETVLGSLFLGFICLACGVISAAGFKYLNSTPNHKCRVSSKAPITPELLIKVGRKDTDTTYIYRLK